MSEELAANNRKEIAGLFGCMGVVTTIGFAIAAAFFLDSNPVNGRYLHWGLCFAVGPICAIVNSLIGAAVAAIFNGIFEWATESKTEDNTLVAYSPLVWPILLAVMPFLIVFGVFRNMMSFIS